MPKNTGEWYRRFILRGKEKKDRQREGEIWKKSNIREKDREQEWKTKDVA